MKAPSRKLFLLPLCAVILCSPNLRAQGSFQNLDFESANVSGYSPGSANVPIASAMPGWTGYYISSQYGTVTTTTVFYDTVSLGAVAISIQDSAGQPPII